MTRRHTKPLPEPWAGPILTLLQITRAAITPPDADPTPWVTAQNTAAAPTTGYKAARRTAAAGQYAAHLLRLQAGRDVDAGDTTPWTRALTGARTGITSWDPDQRRRAATELHRALTHPSALERPTAVPARLVAAWLSCHRGAELVATTAALCAYVLEHPCVDVDDLHRAWHATHGHQLLRGNAA